MSNKKWPIPEDANLILNAKFVVTNYVAKKWQAEVTIEIPGKRNGVHYAHIVAHGTSWAGAMRNVISKIETSQWYAEMKRQGVYFKTTGEGTDTLYRGYYL